jgi:hypothetical protein
MQGMKTTPEFYGHKILDPVHHAGVFELAAADGANSGDLTERSDATCRALSSLETTTSRSTS